MKLIVFSTLWVLCLIAAAVADDFAAAFLENGMGSRALGMGGAYAAVADDISAAYWNPAGLVRNQRAGFMASVHSLSLDRLQSNLAFTLNLRDELAFGFVWQYAGVNDLVGRTSTGVPTGNIDDSENAFYVSAGRRLNSRLAVGASIKILDETIDVPGRGTADANGRGLDLGVQFHPAKRTILALTLRNLGGRLNWSVPRANQQSSNTRNNLATVLTLAAAQHIDRVLLAVDFQSSNVSTHLNLGAEVVLNPTVTLRAGINRLPADDAGVGSATFGLTLRPMRSEAVKFHYTFATDQIDASDRTIFGLSLNF